MGCGSQIALVLVLCRQELIQKLGRNACPLGVGLLRLHVCELLLE